MLEAIREHAQGKVAKVILALIIVPFALWGVDSYLKQGSGGPVVAKVAGQEILQNEFNQTLKEQQDRMRSAMGKSFDPAMLESPEVRKSVLDGLINQRVLLADASREGLTVSDTQLAKVIGAIEAFQESGKFSSTRYEAVLRRQNMSPQMFESRLRQDMTLQAAQESVSRSAFMPKTVSDKLIGSIEQQREVSQATISIDQFMPQVKIEAATVKDYYEKHQSEFSQPEQVRLEYVVLSADGLAGQVNVSEDEVAVYYKENTSRFGQAEERQVSHILISVAASASPAEKTAAQEKARKILEDVRKTPGDFAQQAKKNSQDTGSVAQGGDLGYFARGAMPKPLEDATFNMAPGEISDLVQSDFGYHIIKLTAIKPAKLRSLQEAHNEITQELKKQKASKKFIESAESFSNLVYEQGDSLKPAAQQFGLKVEQSSWTSRKASDTPLLNNPKLLQAVFGEEVLKNKRNTEAVEVAPNTLLAARLLDYKAASVKPFAEVEMVLSQRLQRQQAVVLATKFGKDLLAQLREGKAPAGLSWSQPQLVSRGNPAGMVPDALKEVFQIKTDKLAAYGGMDNTQGGYTLFKVSRLVEGNAMDAGRKQAYSQRFTAMLEREYAAAYLASLRQKTKVEIRAEGLGKPGN